MRHARSDYNDLAALDEKIPDDEPVFLIRGQDLIAPEAVRAWADLAEEVGAEPGIVDAARQWATHMERWGERTRRCKIPDAPDSALEVALS